MRAYLDDACKIIEISGDTLQVIVNQIDQRCEMAQVLK
jgi:hypothetical protein